MPTHEADQRSAQSSQPTRAAFAYPTTVSVLIGQGDKRHAVDATLLAVNSKTLYVRLPSGKVVRRKVQRDVPGWVPGCGEGQLAYPLWSSAGDKPTSSSTWERRGFGA